MFIGIYCLLLGGGSLATDYVSLPFINVKLANPIILALLAWASLMWFFYRFMLENRGILDVVFYSKIRGKAGLKIIQLFTSKATHGSRPEDSKVRVVSMSLSDTSKDLIIYYDVVYVNSPSSIPGTPKTKRETFHVTRFSSAILKAYIFIDLTFTRSEFANLMAPVILFFTAVASGFISAIFDLILFDPKLQMSPNLIHRLVSYTI